MTGGPLFSKRLFIFQKMTYASQLTTTLTFGFTKLTVLLLYKRIFPGETFKKFITGGYCIVFAWTVGYFFAGMLQCWPISINWDGVGWDPYRCIDTNMMYYSHVWSDVFTDLAILAMPLPCIWALQMKLKHKIGVSAIFLLGLLTVGAGVARLVAFNRAAEIGSDFNNPESLDIAWIYTPVIYWPMVESSLGIVGACLPLLRPIFTGATSKGFMRKLHMVNISDSSYPDPDSSRGTESTAAGTYTSSKKHDSMKAYKEFKPQRAEMAYISEDDSR